MLHETVKFFYFSFLTEKPDDLFLRGVLADRVVCLLADVVFDLARILLSGLFVHAEGDEKFCERVVAVEHLCCDRHAAVCQRDEAVAVHLDISVFAQSLGRVGDAGLRHAQMVGHVD